MSQSSNKATPYFELKGPLPSLPAWVLPGSSHRAPSQLSLLQHSRPTRILAASLCLRGVNILRGWVSSASPHLLVRVVAFPPRLTLATCPPRKVLLLPTLSLALCGAEQGERGQEKNRHAGCTCEELLDGWEMRTRRVLLAWVIFLKSVCSRGVFPSGGSLSYTGPCVTMWTMASIGLLWKKYQWIQGVVYPCSFPKCISVQESIIICQVYKITWIWGRHIRNWLKKNNLF